MTLKEIKKELKRIGAEITPFMTNERWVDDDGKLYYIDRVPINWRKALNPMYTTK